jgi:uncharacterized iron-regulated protein
LRAPLAVVRDAWTFRDKITAFRKAGRVRLTCRGPVGDIPPMQKLKLLLILCGSVPTALACTNQAHRADGPAPGIWDDAPIEPKQASVAPDEDVVEKAARPFSGFRPADGATFTDEQLMTFLAAADAICIGERHDQVLDHYAQLRLLEGLSERRPLRGFELGLALEMVRKREQPTLDAYAQGRVSDEEFETLSGWETEWGYPIQFYRPQLRWAAEERVQLIALGVDRELTQRVAQVGLTGLKDKERSQVPEIGPASTEHRALFDGLMQGHPTEAGSKENYYQAQLVWDESMAHVSAGWLGERTPARKLLIMAGSAHCHRSAIPERLARRTGATVVSVLPVDGKPRQPPEGSASSTDERVIAGYDYQMVFSQ